MNKIILSLLGFSLLMGQASADSVKIELTDNVKIRHTKRQKQQELLISDTTLPAGAVIEVSEEALKNARKMNYWDGDQSSQLPFIKGVKIISAPGFSKGEIQQLNIMNEDDGLYVAKTQVEKSRTVGRDSKSRRFESDERIPLFYRNDTPVRAAQTPAVTKPQAADEIKNQDNQKAAERVIERIGQANVAVKATGTNDPHCDLCSKYPIKGFVNQGVPARALMQALDFFDNHQDKIKNRNFITINDYSALSGEKRMFILNMNTGKVEKLYVAHGRGSDAGNGRLKSFYQIGKDSPSHSHKTPSGFHLADFYASPAHGNKSLLLDGMEAKNKDSAGRYIEIHGANYANDSFVEDHWVKGKLVRGMGATGRSWGCAAVAQNQIDHVIEELRGKSLVYNYDGN